MYAPNSGLKGEDITGTGSGNVVISDTRKGVLVSGATGVVSFVANDQSGNEDSVRKVEAKSLGGGMLFSGSGRSPISGSGRCSIYAITPGGSVKKVRVNVTDYAKPASWMNMGEIFHAAKVMEDQGEYITDIAAYFERRSDSEKSDKI
jgi:hypothetical protein